MKLLVCALLVVVMCFESSHAWFWGARGSAGGGYSSRGGWYVGGTATWRFTRTRCTDADQKIIIRSQWGADEVIGQPLLLESPVKEIYLYETGPCKHGQDELDCIKALQTHDQRTGKADIRYNFLVGQDGTVYEGRGWEYQGEHRSDKDDKSIGVGFIGNFKKEEPSTASQDAVNRLILCGRRVEKAVSVHAKIYAGAGLGKIFLDMLDKCEGLRTTGNSCD